MPEQTNMLFGIKKRLLTKNHTLVNFLIPHNKQIDTHEI